MKFFLVKKDVNKPDSQDNWIIMNSFEFSRFIETKDGQERKKNFASLGQCDVYDDIVIIECGYEKAKKWECERLCELYHRRVNADLTTVSYDCPLPDKENYCSDDIVSDSSADVEETVFNNLKNDVLYEALQLLTREEQELIRLMYLSDNPISLKEYAALIGICNSSAHGRKTRALCKLKKYFEKSGYTNEFFA